MHVLFIGGTGLISTAIARQLLEAGHEVTLFNRGKSENRLPQGAKEMHGDRKNYDEFERSFDGMRFDVVCDMVAFSPDDSASAIRAFKGKTGHFLHCSTVCVYSGPVQTIPTPETEPFHSPGSYGQNKIKCEQILMDAHQSQNFPVTIMRPSHSYGEGGDIIRAFGPTNGYIERMRQGKPVILPDGGESVWAACHVDDVAKGFIGVMQEPQKSVGQAYNIAGDEAMTWRTFHEQVAQVAGGTFEPVFVSREVLTAMAPDWSGSMKEILAFTSLFDNSKIKRDTSYSGQTISWKEGVARNLKWLENSGKTLLKPEDDAREDELIARVQTLMASV